MELRITYFFKFYHLVIVANLPRFADYPDNLQNRKNAVRTRKAHNRFASIKLVYIYSNLPMDVCKILRVCYEVQ